MKIWFDKVDIEGDRFITEQFLIIPFIAENTVRNNKDFSSTKTWIKDIAEIIKYTDIEECDVILYPYKLNNGIAKYIKLAKQNKKKVICFYNDDNSKPSCLPTCVEIYRTSLNSIQKKSNEFGLPAWSCDFGDLVDLKIINKKEKPIVGFCGALTDNIRRKAILELNNNTNIISNIIIRDSFWGGNVHNQDIRMEYVRHMNNADLILCCRGAGNFSYRLYECMSLGRIPIIVNTDIVLPCSDVVNWMDISVWVDDITSINENINIFWDNLTDTKYKELQQKIRFIYDTYISPSGFTNYISTKYKSI